jgi:hypothetical protein
MFVRTFFGGGPMEKSQRLLQKIAIAEEKIQSEVHTTRNGLQIEDTVHIILYKNSPTFPTVL